MSRIFKCFGSSGTVLYSVGSGGSTITVVNVEHGQVLVDDGKVASNGKSTSYCIFVCV
jgi:hypothetical protein